MFTLTNKITPKYQLTLSGGLDCSTCFALMAGTVCGNLSIISSTKFKTLVQADVIPPLSDTISLLTAETAAGAVGGIFDFGPTAPARVALPPLPIRPAGVAAAAAAAALVAAVAAVVAEGGGAGTPASDTIAHISFALLAARCVSRAVVIKQK